jgi:hypothetical protein
VAPTAIQTHLLLPALLVQGGLRDRLSGMVNLDPQRLHLRQLGLYRSLASVRAASSSSGIGFLPLRLHWGNFVLRLDHVRVMAKEGLVEAEPELRDCPLLPQSLRTGRNLRGSIPHG